MLSILSIVHVFEKVRWPSFDAPPQGKQLVKITGLALDFKFLSTPPDCLLETAGVVAIKG